MAELLGLNAFQVILNKFYRHEYFLPEVIIFMDFSMRL